MTRPENKEQTNRFFDNMKKKSDLTLLKPDGEKPLAALTGDELLLIDLLRWEKKERWKNFFC